jgi:NAD(P)-dependent dehydrogenase (short-subunit alcohol dehydrogenase family)
MRWFITGASKGLGRAIAEAALRRDDEVVGTVRNATDAAAFDALRPGRSFGKIADVTDREAIDRAVEHAERKPGGIDVLVNNAGVGITGAIEEYSAADLRQLFDVNVFGAIGVLQAVLPGMRERRSGRIVNITSVSGWAPWAGTALYGATKFAMECFGRTLAQEVEEFGIRVTNVAPGGLRTHFATESLRVAERRIADYDGAAHQAERTLRDHAGSEPGDPALAATAILQLVDMADPPLRLLLGADALGYAEAEMAEMARDIERNRDLSLSIRAA